VDDIEPKSLRGDQFRPTLIVEPTLLAAAYAGDGPAPVEEWDHLRVLLSGKPPDLLGSSRLDGFSRSAETRIPSPTVPLERGRSN